MTEFLCPRCGATTHDATVQMDGYVGLRTVCDKCKRPDEPSRKFTVVGQSACKQCGGRGWVEREVMRTRDGRRGHRKRVSCPACH